MRTELERLIAEQARDLAGGLFQSPERPGVYPSAHMNEFPSDVVLPTRDRGELRRYPARIGCGKHGVTFWRTTPKGRSYCTECRKASNLRYRESFQAYVRDGGKAA